MGNTQKSGSLGAGSRFPERRAVPRFAFDAPMEFTDPVEQKTITGRVTVLSQKGCFGRIQEPLAHGTVVRLQIQHGETKFETWARATPACRDGENCVVLVFIDTPPEQAKLLASWLEGLSAR